MKNIEERFTQMRNDYQLDLAKVKIEDDESLIADFQSNRHEAMLLIANENNKLSKSHLICRKVG